MGTVETPAAADAADGAGGAGGLDAGPEGPAPGTWGAYRRRPAAALRPHIVNHTGFRTRFGAPRRRLELPTGHVTLVFAFEEGLWVSRAEGGRAAPAPVRLRPAAGAVVAGPRTGWAIGVHAGAVHGLEVNMTPLGARRLFGLPMTHLGPGRCAPGSANRSGGRPRAWPGCSGSGTRCGCWPPGCRRPGSRRPAATTTRPTWAGR